MRDGYVPVRCVQQSALHRLQPLDILNHYPLTLLRWQNPSVLLGMDLRHKSLVHVPNEDHGKC